MVSVTLSIPEQVKHKMEQFPEMNWSGFIRKTILEKTQELSWKEEMLAKLKQEEPLTKWTLNLQKSSGAARLNELRKKGRV